MPREQASLSDDFNPFAPFESDEWWSKIPVPRDPDAFEDSEVAPVGLTSALEQTLAIDLRAQTFSEVSIGDATRRGEIERIEIGHGETNSDTVAAKESIRVHGKLREHTGRSLITTAKTIETTVRGRMDVGCYEDTILLGGAMNDVWTGGAFISAAMSDDLAAGAGLRVTASADLWLHALMGMEERPATAAADATMTEFYGTLYEREYGTGLHAAGIAKFSGNTYLSTASGFRPLTKVANGVRNLVPGAGTPVSEPVPPSPPAGPAAVAGAAGAAGAAGMVGRGARGVGNLGGSSVKASARMDSITDTGRAMDAMRSSGNAADLRHGADTADQLADLQVAARQGGDVNSLGQPNIDAGIPPRGGAGGPPDVGPRITAPFKHEGPAIRSRWDLPGDRMVLADGSLPPGHGTTGVPDTMLDLAPVARRAGDSDTQGIKALDLASVAEDGFNRNVLDLDVDLQARGFDGIDVPGRSSVEADPGTSRISEMDGSSSRWSRTGSDPNTARVDWETGGRSGSGADRTVSRTVEVDANAILDDMPGGRQVDDGGSSPLPPPPRGEAMDPTEGAAATGNLFQPQMDGTGSRHVQDAGSSPPPSPPLRL